MSEMVIRVHSKSGRSRLTLPHTATLGDLRNMISERLSVPVENQKLQIDGGGLVRGQNKAALSSLGIGNGTILHLDAEAEIRGFVSKSEPVQPPLSPQKSAEQEDYEKLFVRKCTHGPRQRCINCLAKDDAKKQEEGKQEPVKEDRTWLCQHGPEAKCINCLKDDYVAGIKHQSFEHFMNARMSKCQHTKSSRCPNCIPPNEVSYKVKLTCTKHPPWPASVCNSCMPPNAVLARQPYRHVDYVELMNTIEITNLARFWNQSHSMQQRVGFLYGYYAEDPNYPDGVRAVVETIYEPPQIGDMNGFQLLNDDDMYIADSIAGALELEKIGWLFTSINHDAYLSSHEIRMAARYQQEHITVHPSGYKVSKFVTVVLKPTDDGNSLPEAYMVSDQCQTLERDNVFGESDSRKKMVKRQGEENELLPQIMSENQPKDEFQPEWFIVSLGCGIPTRSMTLLHNHDFPIENRGEPIGLPQIQQYLQKHKNEPTWRRCSNFHFLFHLAKCLDLDSALMAAQCVAQETEFPPGLSEIIKSL